MKELHAFEDAMIRKQLKPDPALTVWVKCQLLLRNSTKLYLLYIRNLGDFIQSNGLIVKILEPKIRVEKRKDDYPMCQSKLSENNQVANPGDTFLCQP